MAVDAESGKEPKRLDLSRWDGSGNGWKAGLPLRRDWPQDAVLVDLSALTFVVPTFLLRLRSFIDFNLDCGRDVKILAPRNRDVANYLARMQIAADLPAGVLPDLPSVRASDRGDVLVPITCLRGDLDVEEMGAKLYTLLQGHSEDDVAVFADALQEGFTELCGNGVEHGQNDLGCYFAAQRYRGRNKRTVLSIGDLGIGIPRHMRRIYGDESDGKLLRMALEEGVSGTGDRHRGNGIPSVLDEMRNSRIRHAVLEIHSGRAVLEHRLRRDGSDQTSTRRASNKIGTWICLELGPLD